ncbi:Gfo/Idh/MocA family oxidoreductase [candidate division KSB1 bacterium]|nr:Gfo/Idh/MocA family oxidoreductase [candidate division KSB1 bacterium]NIR72258.1 Gfo/Idh/MocA family oxidoreductase [candidate division KSB1 bacterium]NIS24229.1 Gfo/Idh/MocA family oxidoreductase [candidate division KSB1 bacterium]NIT71143.1 Gfo/Idh/MocA family oxidoreductase [candidate division KSB1 bacterium]NIU24848.1 Gfo/Idh/MocA family oxidoreductase [candidate division KSB1 bacterium]
MSEKVKIGVVGTGAIAQTSHIPIWKKLKHAEIVAVCDVNKNKAQWVAEKFGIRHFFDDPDDLLKIDEIQAVDVCTPTQSHPAVAMSALASGKHVLVEKPMARNFEESQRMVEAAKEDNKLLMVAMNVRFRQDAIVLKSFIKNGELGEIFYAKTGWLQRKERLARQTWFSEAEIAGGGVFMDLGIQMLDVGLWLMGNHKAESVKATTYNKIAQLQVEDSAAAFVKLTNGATLTMEVSWTLLSERDFFYTNLFGTQGGALLNPLRIHKELHGNLVNVTPDREESPTNLYKKSYETEIRHFVECLRGEGELSCSGEEALERMRIIDAVYESAKTGREVTL